MRNIKIARPARLAAAALLSLCLVLGLVPGQGFFGTGAGAPIEAHAMQIFIKIDVEIPDLAIEGNITLEVEPTDRIEDVMALLEAQTGTDLSGYALIFAGKLLEEGNTLQDYSIQKDSTLHLTKVVKAPTDIGETVTFGGHEWYVIGSNDGEAQEGGANAGPAHTLTLLAKESFGSTQYSVYSYENSALHNLISSAFDSLAASDKALVMARDNLDVKYNSTLDYIDHQHYWPLSDGEARALDGALRSFSGDWWLRTYGGSLASAEYVMADGTVYGDGASVTSSKAARPAFWLDMTKAHVLSDGTVTAEHDWGAWTVTVKATCMEKGQEKRVCDTNHLHAETRETSALGHDWGDWIVTTKPTTKAEGVETRYCRHDKTHTETRAVPKLDEEPADGGKSDDGKGAPAKTKAKKVNISFSLGSGKAFSKKLVVGEKYGKLPVPNKSGYKFAGWYTKKKGGARVTARTIVKKSVRLYAHWKKAAPKYGYYVLKKGYGALHIRARADKTARILGYYKAGQRIKVYGIVKHPEPWRYDWYKVKYKGRTAYIDTQFVRKVK
jgi:uncharacterized repeat protein (TIGR02543 family)